MSDFARAAEAMLIELENGLRGPFTIQRNYVFSDHKYASHAVYGNNDPRKMMFIKKIQQAQNSFEFVYLDACRSLSEQKLEFYCEALRQMTGEIVPWDLPSHMFTMLTMIVLIDGEPDRQLVKQIKKFDCRRECRPDEDDTGWSVARLCLIDVHSGKTYCNGPGKTAAERAMPAIKKALTR